MNWEVIDQGSKVNKMTPEETRLKEIDAAYLKLRACMSIQAQLIRELAKVEKEATEAVENLRKVLDKENEND